MGSKKTRSKQTYRPAGYVESGAKQAVALGQRLGSQQHERYTGQRVAGLSQNEQIGMEMARDTRGAALPYLQEGANYARRAGESWVDADQEAYMNPFIKGALDPAAREIREQGALALRGVEDRAASTDAWGRRSQIAKKDVHEATLQEIGDLYGVGYAQAYESAASIFGAERARDLTIAGRIQDIGTNIQRANQTDINTLLASGAVDRNIQQAMADFDYGQFVEERDWDMRNLSGLLMALQGVQGSTTVTQTSETKESGDALGQALGAVATIAAAYFTGGASLAVTGALGTAEGVAGGNPV